MTVMYDNLALALRKSRQTLTQVCSALDISPEQVDVAKIPLNCCDWCGYWDTPNKVITEADGTMYCNVCLSLENMK